jgi:hypothetical protein
LQGFAPNVSAIGRPIELEESKDVELFMRYPSALGAPKPENVLVESSRVILHESAILRDLVDDERNTEVAHVDIMCDSCSMCPIRGVRYKCSVCEDLDFCEGCEKAAQHHHALLKIDHPSKAPSSSLPEVDNIWTKTYNLFERLFTSRRVPELNVAGRVLSIIPKNIHTGVEDILVTVQLENNGRKPWPKNVSFERVSTAELTVKCGIRSLRVGESMRLTLAFQNLKTVGRENSFWCVTYPEHGETKVIGESILVSFEIREDGDHHRNADQIDPIEEQVKTLAKLVQNLPTARLLQAINSHPGKSVEYLANVLNGSNDVSVRGSVSQAQQHTSQVSA